MIYQDIRISEAAAVRAPGIFLIGTRLEWTLALEPRSLDPVWVALRAHWHGRTRADLAGDARIAAVASLYGQLGLDVRRTPPAAQNFIQRFLLSPGKEPPRIHPVVDAVNAAAVEARIPLAVFDADHVAGELVLDAARAGDVLLPIGTPVPLDIPPGAVVLRDAEKVLSWFCYRDADAQKITAGTRRLWLLGCGVPGLARADTSAALDRARALLAEVGAVSAI